MGYAFLRIFDYFTSALTGFLTALLIHGAISPKWSMFTGMTVGMVLGVVALLTVILSLGWVAGSFEILMPGKIIVMIVGMGGGMAGSMSDLSFVSLASFGVLTGLGVGALFHAYDRFLHGERGEVY